MTNVTFKTNFGDITLEIDIKNTPITSENFLNYAKSGFYDNTIFHRVIDGFMIQGGGFTKEMSQKDTEKQIENEADKGIENKTGTISMARTNDPHSATSQFFINLKDNDFLNFKSKDMMGYGYCAFGKVINGMEIVQKIAKVQTGDKAGHQDVPQEHVIIEKTEVSVNA